MVRQLLLLWSAIWAFKLIMEAKSRFPSRYKLGCKEDAKGSPTEVITFHFDGVWFATCKTGSTGEVWTHWIGDKTDLLYLWQGPEDIGRYPWHMPGIQQPRISADIPGICHGYLLISRGRYPNPNPNPKFLN